MEHLSNQSEPLFPTKIPWIFSGWHIELRRIRKMRSFADDVHIGLALGNKRRCEPVVNYEVIEEMNKYIVKKICPAHKNLAGSHCSGAITIHIRRATLLAVTLGTTAVLAAGCSSTGTGFNAALISPVSV